MEVAITGESRNPTQIYLESGKFSLIIDEPEEMGGADEGPSSVQVLLMSLAGCLNVTGHQVAKQKGLSLNGMKISIDGVINPSTFLGYSFEERAGFQKINVNITPDFTGAGCSAKRVVRLLLRDGWSLNFVRCLIKGIVPINAYSYVLYVPISPLRLLLSLLFERVGHTYTSSLRPSTDR